MVLEQRKLDRTFRRVMVAGARGAIVCEHGPLGSNVMLCPGPMWAALTDAVPAAEPSAAKTVMVKVTV